MKRLYSGWTVLALVLATAACSGTEEASAPGRESSPAPSNANQPSASSPSAPSAPASGAPEEATPAATTKDTPTAPANETSAAATPEVPNAVPIPVAPALENSLSGTITDLGGGNPFDGLGGSGTLASAVKVRVSQLVGNLLSPLGEVAVTANGAYELKLPVEPGALVAEVLDGLGNVLAGAVVRVDQNAAAKLVAPPITSETSLEAAILLGAASCPDQGGAGQLDLSLIDSVLGLVDTDLTRAITSGITKGIDPNVLLQALAKAVNSFVHAQALALGPVKLDLDPGAGRVQAQVAARLAFSSTLAQSLANVGQADPIVFAAIHAAAKLEAELTAQVVKQIVELAGASQALIDDATALGNSLVAAVAKATNIPALQNAQLDFVSKLVGSLNGQAASGGLVGTLLTQTTGAVNSLLGSVLKEVEALAGNLDSNLTRNLPALASTDVCLNVSAAAKLDLNLQSVTGVLTQFATDVQALGPDLVSGGNGKLPVAALTNLLTTAQLLLRGLLP